MRGRYVPSIQNTGEEDLGSSDFEVEPASACTVCGGPRQSLGDLGRLRHFRCRNCGAESAWVEPQ